MGRDRHTATIQFAHWISSERRWVMTGTPTKQSTVDLNQIRSLLDFLGHEFFTARLNGDDLWKTNVIKAWKSNQTVSFMRLLSLLQFLMKRHTKLDIKELPAPSYSTTSVPMSSEEVKTYNTLVAGVQSNIYLTSHRGSKTSGEQDSLLHRSQAKYAREALSNILRACVGYARVVPTLSFKFFVMTHQMASGTFGLPEQAVEEVKQYMHRAEAEELTECACCRLDLVILLLMPCCGAAVCVECMGPQSSLCPACDGVFDVDELQRFQPGFEMSWLDNAKQRKLIMKGSIGVPQLMAHQAELGERNDQPVAPLAVQNPNQRRRRHRFGDHECEFNVARADGKCIHCETDHRQCVFLNPHRRCETCHRTASEPSQSETKCYYLITKLIDLHRNYGTRPPPLNDEIRVASRRPLKAIVYSQFRKGLDLVGDRMLARFGSGCVAEYWGRHRTEELYRFTHEPDCFCMLLSNDGSEGLDLSFVTHIFFLEEIWEKSLSDQAVARAWRMGAKGRVEVETLIAENTVEETMMRGDDGIAETDHMANIRPAERQRMKTRGLLQSLRFMTDYHRKFAVQSKSAAMQRADTKMSYQQTTTEDVKDGDRPTKKRKTVSFRI